RAVRLAEVLAELRAVRHHLPLSEVVERTLAALGLPGSAAARFDGPRSYANLRKLVAIARRIEAREPATIGRFIDHIETLRTEEVREGEAPAEEERGNAVCVMTVHASKGLERPVVVAADLARASRPRARTAVVLHDALGPIVMGEQEDGSLAFPPPAVAARDAAVEREIAEERRLLYVALTRARDRLVISTPIALRKDGTPSRTGALVDGLLSAFPELLNGEAATLEGEGWTGRVARLDADVAEAAGRRSRSLLVRARAAIEAGRALDGGDPEAEQAILARLQPLPPDLAARTRFTVTELAHYLHCPRRYELAHVRGLAGYVPAHEAPVAGRLRAHERGTLVHRALQRLGRGPVSEIAEEVDAAARECGLAGHDPEELARIVALLVRFTGSPTWERVRTAAELRSEAPVIAPLGGALVEGQIDALIRDGPGELHLVDYKTGRSQDGGTQAEHRFQVGAYAVAIRQARGRLPATVAVHYLDAGEAMSVDPPAEAAEAERLVGEVVRGIREGRFPPKPDCDRSACPWAWVCGGPV
ncbi:MAG: hypothetical protein FJX74_07750, partial [Armatimonadetes bacterium]|nr:hypothetical protein [Armatimonadota bacterium]